MPQHPATLQPMQYMSIFLRYSGLQCIHCDSWMTRKKNIINPNGLNMDCIKCEKSFKGITISKCRYCQMPLYKEELEHILKTWESVDEDKFQGDQMSGGRCPNCNTINWFNGTILFLLFTFRCSFLFCWQIRF